MIAKVSLNTTMHEMISVETVEKLFLALAGTSLVLGAVAALRSRRIGLVIALVGPANYGLWRLYNAITNRLGLDTMRNLYVNLAVFAAVGLAAGWLIGRRTRAEE